MKTLDKVETSIAKWSAIQKQLDVANFWDLYIPITAVIDIRWDGKEQAFEDFSKDILKYYQNRDETTPPIAKVPITPIGLVI